MGIYRGGRDTTESYRNLDVRRWQRDKLLNAGSSFGWEWSHEGEVLASIGVRAETGRVVLSYRHRLNDEPWQDVEYSVLIEWTPCQFGGSRAWFLCPARGCGRRVAILYSGVIFACRKCHRLIYQCQKQRVWERAMSRARKIRMKLGGSPDVTEWFPPKPKGMHWSTYERLRLEAESASDKMWPPWFLKRMQLESQ